MSAPSLDVIQLIGRGGKLASLPSNLQLPLDQAQSLRDKLIEAGLTRVISPVSLDTGTPTYLECGAAQRFSDLWAASTAVVLLQTMTTLGPVVLFDIARSMAKGDVLTIVELIDRPTPFEKKLLAAYFTVDTRADGPFVFKTVTCIETPPQVDPASGWSFCIPTHSASEKKVAELAGLIGALGLDKPELIIAITGDDGAAEMELEGVSVRLLPVGQASLTEKKNILAREAIHDNLCIYHDRILLPRNFRDMVERFGPNYGIYGLQQLLFTSDDKAVERYSDYHVDVGDHTLLVGASENARETGTTYCELLAIRLRYRSDFHEGKPDEYGTGNYLTGSLYCVEKWIWREIEQNARIEWNELEDVEFGQRCMDVFGVPQRINPNGFGMSQSARAILLGERRVSTSARNGNTIVSRSSRVNDERSSSFGRGELDVRRAAYDFVRKHCPGYDTDNIRLWVFNAPLRTAQEWASYWTRILYNIALPRSRKSVDALLGDFSAAAFGFKYDRGTRVHLHSQIMSGDFFVDVLTADAYFQRTIMNYRHSFRAQESSTSYREVLLDLYKEGGAAYYRYRDFEEFATAMLGSIGEEPTFADS